MPVEILQGLTCLVIGTSLILIFSFLGKIKTNETDTSAQVKIKMIKYAVCRIAIGVGWIFIVFAVLGLIGFVFTHKISP